MSITRTIVHSLGISVVLLATVLSSGCGEGFGEKQTPAAQLAQNAPPVIPPEITAEVALQDVSVLADVNRPAPFLSLIAPPAPVDDPTIEPTQALPPPPTPDPYEGIRMNGIAYRAKRSLAILSFGAGKNKIVHVGDTFTSPKDNSIELTVAKIEKTRLILKVVSPTSDYPADLRMRAFNIPSLVGYGKQETATPSPTPNVSQPAVPTSSGPAGPSIPPGLQNALGGNALNQINTGLSGQPPRNPND